MKEVIRSLQVDLPNLALKLPKFPFEVEAENSRLKKGEKVSA